MNNNHDLTYADISDEKGKLFGKSRKTVFEAINRIEDRYFDGKYILRANGEKSDVLFRWEIKDLLLALLKFEIEDVFIDRDPQKDSKIKKMELAN